MKTCVYIFNVPHQFVQIEITEMHFCPMLYMSCRHKKQWYAVGEQPVTVKQRCLYVDGGEKAETRSSWTEREGDSECALAA